MAAPVKFTATAPKVGAAKGPSARATKPVRFGASRGGPRGGKARGGTPNSGGGGGGGYNSGATWADIPD